MTNNIKTLALFLVLALTLTACTSTTAVLARGAAVAVRAVSKASNSEADRVSLCDYYAQHRAEVDGVREFARTNWSKVPEEYKPSLVAINEQLNACEASTSPTSTRRLYSALQKAVAFYRELRAAGLI
jgi:hypothetical protein